MSIFIGVVLCLVSASSIINLLSDGFLAGRFTTGNLTFLGFYAMVFIFGLYTAITSKRKV